MLRCRSFRHAAGAYEELFPDVVDKLLEVLSAGASLAFLLPLCVADVGLYILCLSLGELPAMCSIYNQAGV